MQENRSSGFPTGSDTNRPVQSQNNARSLEFKLFICLMIKNEPTLEKKTTIWFSDNQLVKSQKQDRNLKFYCTLICAFGFEYLRVISLFVLEKISIEISELLLYALLNSSPTLKFQISLPLKQHFPSLLNHFSLFGKGNLPT